MKDLIKTLTERKEKLLQIANSNDPINPEHHKAHCERVVKATAYAEELDSLIRIIPTVANITVNIVPLNIFEKKLETADYATIEDEGLYFRMAYVTNYPFEKYLMVYLYPLSAL